MSWTHAQELFAAEMPGYESRAEQTRLAEAVEGMLASEEENRLAAQAGCGCIQGDAEIVVNRGGNGRRMTLRDLVVRFNGGRTPGQQRRWNLSIPTYVQREVDGVVRLGQVLHAWHSGVKTTYTVTTDTGRTLRATDEHPFLTERGWLRLDELKVDDELHVRGEQGAGRPRQAKLDYRRLCVLPHPYRNQKTVPEHRLVAEADLNGLEFVDYLARVRAGDLDGLVFLDPEVYAVHHKDHDTLNNALSNLQVMTHAEHHALHAVEGKTNSVLYKVVTERVVSVELFGDEDTYDIEVADDPHNFLVNGVVVHNTGKSFGALVPLIDWALASDDTAVVATATKALQTQYATTDLPFLARLYEADDRPFRWTVIKGRAGYLCADKLDGLKPGDVENLDSLRRELAGNPEHTGDLDELATSLQDGDKAKLTTGTDECPGKADCPFGEVCFAERAKKRAAGAHIVVANHSYAVVDAQVRAKTGWGLLPEYGAIVVDEAHELEEFTTGGLGKEFTQRSMGKFATDVAAFLEDPQNPSIRHFAGIVEQLFTHVLPAILRRDKTKALTPALIAQHGETLVSLWEAIGELRNEVAALKIHGDDQKTSRKKRLRKRAETLAEAVRDVVTAEAAQLVRWVERDEKRGIVLKYAPLHVGEFLDTHLWNTLPLFNETGQLIAPARPRKVVLMSATLTTGGADFSFITRALGLDDYTGFDAGTPFDFATQAALYVPKARTQANPRGFADPSKDKDLWRTQAQQVTKKLVLASGGRALLLFTSREDMIDTLDALGEDFEEAGIRVLAQGQGGYSNRQLADEFRADETSVLFALRSFMTGFDAQGRTLQLVIVSKLPFAVPTDVIVKARDEAADRRVAELYGKSINDAKWHREGSFNGRTIPAAILTLMQAVGRGVRTRNDHALLVVLDPRLAKVGGKAYAKRIVAALPPAKQLENLPEAVGYLTALNEDALIPA